MKFQLLAGKHAQPEPTGEIDPRTGELALDRDTHLPQAQIITYDATDPGRTRSAGNIILSAIDLCHRYNSPDPSMPRKFARIYDNEEPGNLTVAQHPGETRAELAARLRAQADQLEAEERGLVPQSAGQDPLHPVSAQPAQRQYQPPDHGSTLEAMSLDELKKFAEAEEISIGTAKTKEQVLKVLKSAASATSAHG